MLILRVAEGIREHFPARKSEWVLSIAVAGWGYAVLSGPPDTFLANPAYAPLTKYTPDGLDPATWWGGWALAVGLVRLAALTINGTFIHTRYGRVSPHVRALLSFATCFVWAQIALGLWASGDPTTGRFIYPMLFLLDLLNAFDGVGDAGDIDRNRRRARYAT